MTSVQNQIDSNAAYAKKLQEEEMNFGFKPQFDTQGNSNLAKRIGMAESAGASEEDIEVILSEHDYVRSSMLTPKIQPQIPTPQPSPPATPAAVVPPSQLPSPPKKIDKPARPDTTPTKVVKKAEKKAISLFDKLITNLPTIVFVLILLFFIYKVFYPQFKGSKGKGKGKGKGKK